jgi:isorenieratene synthase
MTDDTKTGLTRRGFLKAWGISSAAIVGGGTGAAYAGRARPEDVVSPEPHLPVRTSERRRVVVVGGGLAGLSTGIELAERGFEVELFEAGTTCGGRVGGFRTRVDGVELTHEHGFHGFFYQYYNLSELIDRTADRSDYIPVDAYPIVYRGLPTDILTASRAPFPFNMMNVVVESTNLDFAGMAAASPSHIWDMLRYDPVKTFEELDHITFEAWCKSRGVAPSLYDYFYDPYVRTMFVRPDEVSAAEMIQMFHSYFIANPEGMGMDVLRRPSLDSLIEPLTRYFEKLGGVLHTSAPIHALDVEGNQVRGVVRMLPGAPATIGRVAEGDVPATGYLKVQTELGSAYVSRTESGYRALDARCTHQGCPINPAPAGGGFHCPCHGGRYNAEGEPIAGPPKQRLAPLEAIASAGTLELRSSLHSRAERIPADYVVLATDVKGAQQIARRTDWPGAAHHWLSQIDKLGVCRPYSVARQWLDRPLNSDRHLLYTTGGFDVVDEVFLFSQFQEQPAEWARNNKGSVIETHCYALDVDRTADPEKLHDDALLEAAEILPELEGARPIHRELQLLDNFSGYDPGAFATRPGTETPFENLHLAGDYVRIDLPLELMERATVSGRIAANLILKRESVARVGIRTPPVRGILA